MDSVACVILNAIYLGGGKRKHFRVVNDGLS
jgi:hypothetical protein